MSPAADRLRAMLAWARVLLSKIRLPSATFIAGAGGAIAFCIVALFLVRAFDQPTAQTDDNVALAWNQAIGRLWIEPVYPPQEDLFVGDVYLNLRPTKEGIALPDGQTGNVFAGRGIRIDRINLLPSLSTRPFKFKRQTASLADTTKAAESPAEKPAMPALRKADEIELYATAFPGISIKHFIETNASWLDLAIGRRSAETEEIVISSVETYSAAAPESTRQLLLYCSEPATAHFCQDQFARTLLAYSFGPDVNRTINGQYAYEITVTLVRQVFLTTDLTTARYRGDALNVGYAPIESQAASSANDAATKDATPPISTKTEASGDFQNRYSSHMTMKQKFRQPVAFGFRSVSVSVPLPDPVVSEGKK